MSAGTPEDCDTLPSTWRLWKYGNTISLVWDRIDGMVAGITPRGNFKRYDQSLDDWTEPIRLLKYNRTGKILEIKSYEPPMPATRRSRNRRKAKRRA